MMHWRKAELTLIVASIVVIATVAEGKGRSIEMPPANGSMAESLRVGGLQLQRCAVVPAYCAKLDRPLDPTGEVSGTISIYFEFYPHRDHSQPALEPIVAEEGGPGYPSSGSRAGYVALFSPLMDRHDLILMDQRGTGHSQVINCPAIQRSPYLFLEGIEECGAYLGNTADLYGSGLASDDLAAILDALGVEKIDLYGDSYGTFFSQTFAGRHPERLRSVVLDSAYPVENQSPWYPEATPAMRRAFQSTCDQSLACTGDSMGRISQLVSAVRAHPFSGQAYDGDGKLLTVTAEPNTLALLAFGNSTGPVVYRELDAAARAYLDKGQQDPLLRLLAENFTVSQSGVPPYNPNYYSAGLFVAVSCEDYPFVYDLTKPPAERLAEKRAAFAYEQAQNPGVYAPFTIEEFNAMPIDYSVLDTCLPWPIPSAAYPPGHPVPPGATFTAAPVIVLSGSLDSLTPAAQGKEVTRLFANARQIHIANSFHVTAVGDQDDCASTIVRTFVETLDPGDTSCAANITEVRTVPQFAEYASEVDPASPTAGNQGSPRDLQIAAAATLSAGDAIARWWVNLSGSGVGLRGGNFSYGYSNGVYRYQLSDYRFVNDVAVSGPMEWLYAKPGTVTAHLSVTGPAGEMGTLDISWHDREPHAAATISGTLGGRVIAATMYAP
jgi:pimeloyl-ACP methyl ester carboxylesterase